MMDAPGVPEGESASNGKGDGLGASRGPAIPTQ